ncbi:hypothetical protein [Microvirga brassicacearum]|uniref:Uncharacterized protein n=1 Tax=Microvirga brassicacearum TaxID=2580413 RepID=A0A5N3P4K7_9HYPH|nr:hypothetical protein [Microvirga brassicacearum]KAB0264649.1 hypothetical protein FEZ63_22265 [Microvirga brassicacearum]
MSEQQSPLDSLKIFRELLVEERRRVVVKALKLHKENGEGGDGFGLDIQLAQEQIEAVDHAIADETLLQPPIH